MRRTILRRTVVVPLVLLLSLLGPGAASASPLASATAYAYGISLSIADQEILAPTPEQSAGPGPGTGSQDLVQVPAGEIAFSGTIGAKAQTTLESTINSELGDQYLNVVSGGPGLPSTYNAQSYARTEGLAVAAGDALTPEVASVINLVGTDALLAADLVHSEALVACTDGNATVVGGGQVVGL
ncbi:MAG: hypothetical protein KY393_08690, partial [Actinobacteria bacterium]|nr:hypothetical protein [Actinomycetota bacterium]